MKLTAEMSLYPLREDYIPAIEAFIAAANDHGGMKIVTNAMSTQICGEYDQVFTLLREELRRSYQQYGKQVLVCKLFPGELGISQ